MYFADMTRKESIEQIFEAGSNGDPIARSVMGMLLYEAGMHEQGTDLLKEMAGKGIIWARDLLATIARGENSNHIRHKTGLTPLTEKQLVNYVAQGNIYAMTVIGILKQRMNDEKQKSVGIEYLDAAKNAGCLWAEDQLKPIPPRGPGFFGSGETSLLKWAEKRGVPAPSEKDWIRIVSKKYGY